MNTESLKQIYFNYIHNNQLPSNNLFKSFNKNVFILKDLEEFNLENFSYFYKLYFFISTNSENSADNNLLLEDFSFLIKELEDLNVQFYDFQDFHEFCETKRFNRETQTEAIKDEKLKDEFNKRTLKIQEYNFIKTFKEKMLDLEDKEWLTGFLRFIYIKSKKEIENLSFFINKPQIEQEFNRKNETEREIKVYNINEHKNMFKRFTEPEKTLDEYVDKIMNSKRFVEQKKMEKQKEIEENKKLGKRNYLTSTVDVLDESLSIKEIEKEEERAVEKAKRIDDIKEFNFKGNTFRKG